MKRINILLLGILVAFTLPAQAQWTLDDCIKHAIEHNYTVKQNMINLEAKRVQLASAKMNIAPSLSASVGQNIDFGRSKADNGIIESQSRATTSFGVSMGIPLFEGLRNINQVKAAKFDMQSSVYDLEQTKENIELNVIAYYLNVLLYKELLEVSRVQAELSKEKVNRVEELVKSGKRSESEFYTAKAIHAADQHNIVDAYANLRLALLDLRQLLNLQDENFDVVSIDSEDFEVILHQPFPVYDIINNRLQKHPELSAIENKIKMSEKNIRVARSGWYPSLAFSASYGTGYYHALNSDFNLPFNTQFSDNAQEMFSLSLSIPIFDKLNTYHSVKLNKITLTGYEIQLEEAKVNLEKEIKHAYANAAIAKEKYLSSEASLEAAQVALEYEKEKYNAGSSTTFEYNEAKTNYEKSMSDLIQAKYSFLIRKKILDFYGR